MKGLLRNILQRILRFLGVKKEKSVIQFWWEEEIEATATSISFLTVKKPIGGFFSHCSWS